MQISLNIYVPQEEVHLVPLIEAASRGCNLSTSVLPQAAGGKLLVVSSEDAPEMSASRFSVLLASVTPALQAAAGMARVHSQIYQQSGAVTQRVAPAPLAQAAYQAPVLQPAPITLAPVQADAAEPVESPCVAEVSSVPVEPEDAPEMAPLQIPIHTQAEPVLVNVPAGAKRPLVVSFVVEEKGVSSEKTATIFAADGEEAVSALRKMFPRATLHQVDVVRDFGLPQPASQHR